MSADHRDGSGVRKPQAGVSVDRQNLAHDAHEVVFVCCVYRWRRMFFGYQGDVDQGDSGCRARCHRGGRASGRRAAGGGARGTAGEGVRRFRDEFCDAVGTRIPQEPAPDRGGYFRPHRGGLARSHADRGTGLPEFLSEVECPLRFFRADPCGGGGVRPAAEERCRPHSGGVREREPDGPAACRPRPRRGGRLGAREPAARGGL